MWYNVLIRGYLMHEVVSVKPLKDFLLQVTFEDGSVKIFDVKPMFTEDSIFNLIHNDIEFSKVYLLLGAVTWCVDGIELDLCPNTMYAESKPI
jgi:hypothetical protein